MPRARKISIRQFRQKFACYLFRAANHWHSHETVGYYNRRKRNRRDSGRSYPLCSKHLLPKVSLKRKLLKTLEALAPW